MSMFNLKSVWSQIVCCLVSEVGVVVGDGFECICWRGEKNRYVVGQGEEEVNEDLVTDRIWVDSAVASRTQAV